MLSLLYFYPIDHGMIHYLGLGVRGVTMKLVNMNYKSESTSEEAPDTQKPALALHAPVCRPEPLWPEGSFHWDCSLQGSEVEEDADPHDVHTARNQKASARLC